jgi:hypothetical protein
MEGIPSRFTARCEFCGCWLDTRKLDVRRWTEGWMEPGRDEFSLVMRRDNRWAHERCVKNAERENCRADK